MKLSAGRPLLGVALIVFCNQVLAQFEKRHWSTESDPPNIEYTDISGNTWNGFQLKGKIVVLNFWATWCAPCMEEMPSLQKLQDNSQSNQLLVLTINNKESPGKIQQFIGKNQFTLPVITDRQGVIAKKWGVKIFPTSIVLSHQGKPMWIIEGAVDWTGQEMQELLKNSAISPSTTRPTDY